VLGERVSCCEIEIEIFVGEGALSTIGRETHTDSPTPLPSGGQVLPDSKAWSQYRPIIARLGFPGRRLNSEKRRKRQCFGFLQHHYWAVGSRAQASHPRNSTS
jgi:hypothetical protein